MPPVIAAFHEMQQPRLFVDRIVVVVDREQVAEIVEHQLLRIAQPGRINFKV